MHSDNKFIVTCQARTGSTMLCTALQSHPELSMHGEVLQGRQFHPDRMDDRLEIQGLNYNKIHGNIYDYLRSRLTTDSVSYMNEIIFHNGRYKAAGFKFKYEELSSKLFSKAAESILNNKDVKVIHLYRINLWERYISEYIAVNITKQFNIRSKQVLDTPQEGQIKLDPKTVEEAFTKSKKWYKHYVEAFSDHDVYSLTYEQLKQSPQECYNNITNFLGVSTHDWLPMTKKLSYPSYDKLVTNYDEIVDHFGGTEYEKYFKKKAVTSTASDNCS